jgi:hypothetical protein
MHIGFNIGIFFEHIGLRLEIILEYGVRILKKSNILTFDNLA